MARFSTTGWIDQFGVVRGRLGRLMHEIAAGLEALHRVQFDEPWKTPGRAAHGSR